MASRYEDRRYDGDKALQMLRTAYANNPEDFNARPNRKDIQLPANSALAQKIDSWTRPKFFPEQPYPYVKNSGQLGPEMKSASGGYKAPQVPGDVNGITAVNSATGAYKSMAINPRDPQGVILASRVNTMDLNKANEEYAKANAIRQQIIDSQRGAGVVIPQQTSATDRILNAQQRNALAFANTPSTDRYNADRNRLYRAGSALDQAAGNAVTRANALTAADVNRYGYDTNYQSDLYGANLRADTAQSALEAQVPTRASAIARNNAFIDKTYNDILSNSVTLKDVMSNFVTSGGQLGSEDYYQMLALITPALQGADKEAADAQLNDFWNTKRTVQPFSDGGIVSYADGGIVSSATGALGPVTPPNPPPAVIQHYQQYADGARAMGLSVIPFDKFMALNAPRQEPQMNFADGGMVPDASGKFVIDPDPNAPTDSIPAMVDGKQPAALDSGEFVIPKDVVLFWGTDKLKKMIDKAREEQNGSAGKSATGATS